MPSTGSAQQRMPLTSPMKPVNAVADSVPVPVMQDPAAEGFEELIVEIRAGQEASLPVFALAREHHIWVPAVAVFELVELSASVDSLGVLSSMLAPERYGLHLYSREMEAWRGNYYRLTHERDLFLLEGELYAKAVDLAWVLDVQLYEDFTEMTVVFDGIGRLPLGRRLHRERMRRIDEMFSGEPDVIYGAEREPWSGATLDWNLGIGSFQELERTNLGLGFGGAFFGGAMDARYRGRVDGTGPQTFDASWQGVWPDQTWMRQLSLGSTRGAGPRGRAIEGVFVSNSPFLRSSRFGETILRGSAEPGWEVEIYRHGRLLAFDRVDERGHWEFPVPIDYGQNPVEVRVYGPNGEVQITERAVRVDFDRLPPGTMEYGLSAGSTEIRDAQFTSNADFRYGINRKWTARAGYEGYRLESGDDLHHPYMALTGSLFSPIRVGAERVVDAWWWTGASLEPSSDFRIGFERFRYDRQGAGPILINDGDQDRTRVDFFLRPFRQRRNMFFDADIERLQTSFGQQTRLSVGGTTMIRRVRTSAQLKENFDRTEYTTFRQSALAVQASMVLRSEARSWWHGTQVRVQTELDTGAGSDDWLRASVGRRVGRDARLEIGGAWYRIRQGGEFTIGLSSVGSHAYVNASMSGRNHSGVTSQLTAEGSLLYQPERGKIQSWPFRSLGRGGLSGTVFVDANGNGIFDSGEETVPGARLLADHFVAETDEFGRYSIWNLVPFEGADIQVEPSSLRNPMWVPAFDLAKVAVSPNGFRRIDLPLLEAVEVEGVVHMRVGAALHRAGAVPITLVQLDGEREYKTRCFSDGEFYLLGVVPGQYRIEIDADWLQSRGLRVAGDSELKLSALAGSGLTRFELLLESAGLSPSDE